MKVAETCYADENVKSEARAFLLPRSEQVAFRVLYDYRFFLTPASRRVGASKRLGVVTCGLVGAVRRVVSLTQPKRNATLILINRVGVSARVASVGVFSEKKKKKLENSHA